MDSYVDNVKAIIIAAFIVFGLALFFLMLSTFYCVDEVEKLKEYHSNTCFECGQVKK